MASRAWIRTCCMALLVAVLLAPTSSASPLVHAQLQARELRSEAAASLHGDLVALMQEQGIGSSAETWPGFGLEAKAIRVELDQKDPVVKTPVTDVGMDPTTTPQSYDNAQVYGTAVATGFSWHLFSSDPSRPARLEASSSCSDSTAADADSISRQPHANGFRAATTRDTSRAVEVGCLDGARVAVDGDFILSLWAWNATLTAEGKSVDIGTGAARSTTLPTDSPDTGRVESYREAFLYVTGGHLTVPSLGAAYSLYVQDLSVSSPDLRLHGATGVVAVAGQEVTPLNGATLGLVGNATVTLSGSGAGNPMSAVVDGTPSAVLADGATVRLEVAPGLPAWLLWAAAPALAAAAYAAFRLGAFGGYERWMGRAFDWSSLSPRRSLIYAVLGGQLSPRDPQWRLLAGQACTELARHGKAAHHFLAAYDTSRDPEDRSIAAYERARSQAFLGRAQESGRWLATALRLQPEMAKDAARDLAFRSCQKDPLFQQAMRGSLGTSWALER